jgi:HEAT repeat protein
MKSRRQELLLVAAALFICNRGSLAETPQDKAWTIIQAGVEDKSSGVRVLAVGPLGLVPNNPRAAALAEEALEDANPEVRAAGARALGEMHHTPSIPKLRKALGDKENSVVTAAAHSLVQLKDPAGYELYYSVLTGTHKNGQGFISEKMEVLRDPKKVAQFSLQEGIGFVPFGGYGLSAVQFIRSQERDASTAKAVAARFLAHDPDPESKEALVLALSDKSSLVREAALEAIAQRGDPSLLDKVQPPMSDAKGRVRYTAAATVIRLTDVAAKKGRGK